MEGGFLNIEIVALLDVGIQTKGPLIPTLPYVSDLTQAAKQNLKDKRTKQ